MHSTNNENESKIQLYDLEQTKWLQRELFLVFKLHGFWYEVYNVLWSKQVLTIGWDCPWYTCWVYGLVSGCSASKSPVIPDSSNAAESMSVKLSWKR